MPPITFYPGPSKVYPQVAGFMQDAYEQGILSINHRSSLFMDICQQTVELLKEKLAIPADYLIMFTSSATEGWEIVAQSLTQHRSFHVYTGAFGQKWLEYARKLKPLATGQSIDYNRVAELQSIAIPVSTEIICFTQNETSNGTQVVNQSISYFRKNHPDTLLAVDVTSSLGGIALDFTQADVWLASVQKCLGLPAGLGLFICSPKAIEKARQLGENDYYNSLLFIHDNIQKFQTPYTPNVLGIYLLMRVMEMVEPIAVVSQKLKQQAQEWYTFLDSFTTLKVLVGNTAVRSDTVITVSGEEAYIQQLKAKATAAGIGLGNGYGAWKSSTFRIANFPAITSEEIAVLKAFLQQNCD
jgi:phosphoserine aminotransferase